MSIFTKNSHKDLREVYKAAEQIQQATAPRDVDVLTGYAAGIADEKLKAGKLTQATADALVEMIFAVGEDAHRAAVQNERERERREQERKERREQERLRRQGVFQQAAGTGTSDIIQIMEFPQPSGR